MFIIRLFYLLLLWSVLYICQGDLFISKYYDSYTYQCVTNTSFAMDWIIPTIEKPIKTVSTYIPEGKELVLDESWVIKNSLKENFNHLILDERWEEITPAITRKQDPIFKNVITNLKGDVTIPLSIRRESQFHIFFCDGMMPPNSKCYWFMLQAYVNRNDEGTAIRKCENQSKNYYSGREPRNPCNTPKKFEKITSKDQKYLSNAKWSHFEIGKKGNNLFFKQFDNNVSKNIIEWSDDEGVINVSNMIIQSTKSNGLWKIHEVDYKRIDIACQTNLGKFSKNKDNSVCVSMYIAMCENCKITLTATGTNHNEHETYTYKRGWTKIKYIVDNVGNDELTITLSTIGNDQDKFWAIDHIRSCHKEEYRKIETAEKALCQLMSNDKNIVLFTEEIYASDSTCPESTIGDLCMPCDLLYTKGCEQLKVCTTKKCVCSAGYEGPTCYYDCQANHYGHGCRRTCGTNCKNCQNIDGKCGYCSNNYKGYRCDKGPGIFFNYPPEVANVSYTEATIIVKNFEIYNGEDEEYPETYEIQYKQNGRSWMLNGKYLLNNSQAIILENLQAGINYSVKAVIITDKKKIYNDSYVKIKTFSTKCEEFSDDQLHIEPSNTSITIQISNKTCAVNKFKLYIYPKMLQIGPSTLHHTFTKNKILFDHLTPHTNYIIILIDEKGNKSNFSRQTSEGVPNPVTELYIINRTSTTVKLRWDEPELYGELENYVVEYQHLSFLGCKQEKSKKEQKPIMVQTNTAEIYNLIPYSNYTISVFAKNKKFSGMPYKISTTTLELDVIEENEIPSIENIVTTAQSAVINLRPSNCSKQRGPLKFKIMTHCKSEWCQKKDVEEQNFNSDTFNLPLHYLQPFSEYIVTLKVCRRDDLCSNITREQNFTTNATAPNEVRDPLVYSKTNHSISLRWKPPYPPTGHISRYEFFYSVGCEEDKLQSYGVMGETSCTIWTDFQCKTIKNLESNKSYKIAIRAINKESTSSGQVWTTCSSTKIEKSRAPYDLNVNWSDTNDLLLNWKRPNVTNGDIVYFQIEIRGQQQKEFTLTENGQYNLTFYYKVPITELVFLPLTNYTIVVRVFNGLNGEVIWKASQSPPDVPEWKNISIISSTNDTITVDIWPIEPRGVYNLSFYVLVSDIKFDFAMFKTVCDVRSFDQQYTVTIGNTTKLEFCNQTSNDVILEPETDYNVTVILVNRHKDQKRLKKYSSILRTQNKKQSERILETENNSLWGLLALFLIIPLVAIIYMKRHKLASLKTISFRRITPSNQILDVRQNDPISLETVSNQKPIILPKKTPKIMTPKPSTSSKIHSKKIKILDIEEYLKKSIINGELERQHALFPRGQTKPWDYGLLKENKIRNRYNNLLAYDHSRVVLSKIDNDPYSDYINANYIDGDQISKAYIATQGPKQVTLKDFWRMIWEKNVKHIVMVANVFENGKKKSEMYWPTINQSLRFGEITVTHKSAEVFADFEHRKFVVSYEGETRKVDQLHFLSWPDHGVPLYSQSLVPFLRKMLQIHLTPTSPVVVHCSAGVGRTGTILLCDICLRMSAREGVIDPLRTLQKLRGQRPNMVDNVQQYKLAHLVILECLVAMKTSIPCKEIDKFEKKLLDDGGVAQQMQYLRETQWQDEAMKTIAETEEANIVKEKNRFSNIIPEMQGRIFIARYPPSDENSSYINAVAVDGFRSPGRFIVTQQPLPNTLGDFWRLVEENNVSVIISLNEINRNDQTSCNFWPTQVQKEMNPVDFLKLSLVSSIPSECYDLTTINMVHKANESQRQILIVSAKNWPYNVSCPKNLEHFLTFWLDSDATSRRSSKVVVTCYDGVTASGLYVAMSFIIEKIKLEQECDVCQAVRTVRHNRNEFIQTEEQFIFLYQSAINYINGFQCYANFD